MTMENMTKTEYLFGHKKGKYRGLEALARERIQDGNILKGKLQSRVKYYPDQQNKFQLWLSLRIRKVSAAIIVWEKILEEEK